LWVVGLTASLGADDWPHWRGPANTGASRETGLPTTWNDTRNVAWKTRLTGLGVSSPVASGNRVYVTSQVGSGASRMGPRLGQGADASPGERSLGRDAAVPRGPVRFVVEALSATDGRRL
jgi:hypothetical protein